MMGDVGALEPLCDCDLTAETPSTDGRRGLGSVHFDRDLAVEAIARDRVVGFMDLDRGVQDQDVDRRPRGHGGGEALAKDMEVPFLGRLPIQQAIREGSDAGVPVVTCVPVSRDCAIERLSW